MILKIQILTLYTCIITRLQNFTSEHYQEHLEQNQFKKLISEIGPTVNRMTFTSNAYKLLGHRGRQMNALRTLKLRSRICFHLICNEVPLRSY